MNDIFQIYINVMNNDLKWIKNDNNTQYIMTMIQI